MTLKRPWLMQPAGGDGTFDYSALDVRALLGVLIRNEGILPAPAPPGGSALKVSQRAAGANFSVDVSNGAGVITGDDVSDQGMYLVQSTAVENLVIPAPPGSGTRTHRVIARVKDHLHNGSWAAGTYAWTLEVLEDTGSGTPATPSTAISLATVAVSSGATSVTDATITDTRVTALLGPGRPNNASASSIPANPGVGEEVWRTDTKVKQLYDGTQWWDTIQTGAWTSYTPALTASSSNPALGTGSVVNGSWTRHGRRVTVNANIVFGTSGAAAGSGTYRISLPVAAKTLTGGYHLGAAFGNDNSASNGVDGICRVGASGGWDKAELLLSNTLVTNGAPFAWANNDLISLTITYEAAS